MPYGGRPLQQVSRLCEELEERVTTFLGRPIEGDWPYLWIDATYVKVRQNGRIASVAVIIAVGVNSDGRREVLGMDIAPSEAELFWMAFLRKLTRRSPCWIFASPWMPSTRHRWRCRVLYFVRSIAHVGVWLATAPDNRRQAPPLCWCARLGGMALVARRSSWP